MTGRIRSVLALLAGALLAAGCSNHSGLRKLTPPPEPPSASGVAAPQGLAGAGPASSSRSHPTPRRTTPPARSATAAPDIGAAVASAPRPRHRAASSSRVHSSARGSSSSTPRSATSRPPSSSPAGPRVSVSPATGLQGGQLVWVTGAGFAAGEQLQVRQCRVRGSCLNTLFDGASADGAGGFDKALLASSSVGGSDCGATGCVIAVQRADGTQVAASISFA